ncbi:TIM barrel protein [Terriglobus roseus]|uniref:Hydroxypyruvate isomerase n=1 Tax=Terriglobus roseus TaxID=392734 RepID=A0A1G7P0R1_9BACT|nr:TIM barrel protein [Terriglobus roseus]SDF79811.1 hydroxypyruvate isomerase [Terriglobus roseus]
MNRREPMRAGNFAPGAPSWRFSSMLWNLNRKVPMEQRLEMLAAAGYTGAELVDEWRSWTPQEMRSIVAKRHALGIDFDLIFPAKVSLTDTDKRDLLRAQVKEAIPVAQELGTKQFSFNSGPHIPGATREQEWAAISDGLKIAADALGDAKIAILLEPIDVLENAKLAINSAFDGFALVRALNDPRIKVLYDLYHEQRGTGNVIETLRKNIDLTATVHIADVPGRHRPGTGEMNYANIYRELARLNYSGYICMEFYPLSDTTAELKAAREEALAAARTA